MDGEGGICRATGVWGGKEGEVGVAVAAARD